MAARIPIEKFLPLYMQAVKQGLTREDFARTIGLKPSTVYQRAYELRSGGVDVPLLQPASRVSTLERAKAIVAEYQSNSTAEPTAVEALSTATSSLGGATDLIAELLS
jgi:hypothetical protein